MVCVKSTITDDLIFLTGQVYWIATFLIGQVYWIATELDNIG